MISAVIDAAGELLKNKTERKAAAIKPMPAHKPSILSIKLKAFVMPTIQNIVISVSNVRDVNQCMRNPRNATKDAIRI